MFRHVDEIKFNIMLNALLIILTLFSQFYIGQDLKFAEMNNNLLLAAPTCEISEQFLKSGEIASIFNQEYAQDSSFTFNKLIFHTTSCYGSCPVIDLEISSDKSIRFSGNYFKDGDFNELDSARSGNFTGQLSDQLYTELMDLIISSKITEVDFNQNQILCCDAPIKTLILYHNDTRKYYKAMFEPKVLKALISFLYSINQNLDLTQVDEKFTFEK